MGVIDDEGQPIHLGWRVLLYIPWLIKEIIEANLAVTKIVLDPKLPISPTTYCVRASQKSDLGKVIYANSITLTPGTVTMDMDGDKLLVHAVSTEMIADQDENEMDRRVSALEVDG
jgi:multicomponent Na+:H+ antiporter subunit E